MPDIAGVTQSNPWDDVGSAGVVPERTATVRDVHLSSGEVLERVDVVYETLGTLSPARDNVVLVCHALSGDAHVAGRRESDPGVVGWWDAFVGPGKAIDTDHYFVVASNVLGGCSGTTGPSSIDPRTGKPYGLDFPIVTIEDMVEIQARLLDSLGIDRLLAVVGGSMGGMQALAWAKQHPQRVASVLGIATTWRLAAQAIAFNEVGRTAILGDSAFADGAYYGGPQPKHGLAIARMIGHITYLSDESMREKFGRRLRDRDEHAFEFVSEFEVESYLAYQGRRFTERFDANTYLYMTKAMDYFDLIGQDGTLADALRGTPSRWLVLSFSSDWLFPTYQSRELVDALRCIGAR
ncbi:MAG: homoserine O-acetyltransferase, partial [Coriobacteriia bacterium]|nr:homoserine O-acetyltransferase [Coriobacteriia bacterium]